eukprot:gene20925-27773_t
MACCSLATSREYNHHPRQRSEHQPHLHIRPIIRKRYEQQNPNRLPNSSNLLLCSVQVQVTKAAVLQPPRFLNLLSRFSRSPFFERNGEYYPAFPVRVLMLIASPTIQSVLNQRQPLVPAGLLADVSLHARFPPLKRLLSAVAKALWKEADCSVDRKDGDCVWDEVKETRRRGGTRTVFGFDDWKRHRSNDRFYKNMRGILISGVIKGIVVALYNHASVLGHLPVWIPAPPVISYQSLGVTSFALSLLLAFYWFKKEDMARKRMLHRWRVTLANTYQCHAFYWFKKEDMARKRLLHRWLVALAKTCQCHVHTPDVDELRRVMGDVLKPPELEMLIRATHRPSFCLQMITEVVHSAGISTYQATVLDQNIGLIGSAISECEGILYHPIPLSYTRHTGRFLMAWMACLPFSLWSVSGWTMVPVMALVAFVLL